MVGRWENTTSMKSKVIVCGMEWDKYQEEGVDAYELSSRIEEWVADIIAVGGIHFKAFLDRKAVRNDGPWYHFFSVEDAVSALRKAAEAKFAECQRQRQLCLERHPRLYSLHYKNVGGVHALK